MNNKRPDTGNYMIALFLSAVVLIIWQYFFIGPLNERQRAAQKAAGQQHTEQTGTTVPGAAAVPGIPGAPVAPGPVTVQSRDQVLASGGARLAFENDKVDGTIRLTGAQLDDLRLKKYRDTIDPNSPEVVFLTPHGTPVATFAEAGWAPAPGSRTKVPDATSVWTTSDAKLTPATPVTLTWNNGEGLTFIRKISIDQDYMFSVADSVQNAAAAPVTLYPYALVTREGEPVHAAAWTLHEGLFGVLNGLLEKYTYKDLRDAKEPETRIEGTAGWLGITDKYWMATVVPPQNEKYTARVSIAREPLGEVFRADYLLRGRNVAAGGSTSVTHRLYAGAKIVSLIESYETSQSIYRFNMSIDWGWFSPITYRMFQGLDYLNKLVGNFGVAIILLTIIVKILFFPLANRSYESMTKMKKIQPEMKELQERFKDDKVKAQQEVMALYRREKVNPLMGCLPMLLQIPIFFSLYKVLYVTIEMRHAPFFGWIHDLAAADPTNVFNLFGLIPFDMPHWLHIGAWPLVMGLTMWFQMKMSPPSTDPTQRQMQLIMPPMFTYLMGQFAAGLVVYWTVNNLLSIAQQYVIMRRLGVPLDLGLKMPSWLSSNATGDKPPPGQA